MCALVTDDSVPMRGVYLQWNQQSLEEEETNVSARMSDAGESTERDLLGASSQETLSSFDDDSDNTPCTLS